MANIERALVVGAGICGLGVGLSLSQQGIETQVVEIKPEPDVAGVGINQPGNSLRAMKRLGIFEEVRESGFEVDRIDFHDAEGHLLVRVPYHLASEGIPNAVGIARRELHRILIAANQAGGVDLRYGTSVAELKIDGSLAEVVFSDGREETFDLVVGADGVNSTTRRQIFGGRYERQFTGAGSWRLTVPRPDWVEAIALFQGVGGKAGYIPLSRDTMYLLLVRAEQYPARFERSQLPAMLRERLSIFGSTIAEIRERIRDDDDVVYGPLHEVKIEPPWNKGPVVLCGDAVHACAPHLTQGAAMAFEDAVVLAEELAADRSVADCLVSFARRRYPRARLVQDVSRIGLNTDLEISNETRDQVLEDIQQHMPERAAQVDAVLLEAP